MFEWFERFMLFKRLKRFKPLPSYNTMRITTLLLDIGGVLLTNGWGRNSRKLAAETFSLDHDDMEERHHLTFDTYEEGKLSLDEYLNRVVFPPDMCVFSGGV